jgi:hypothetical protein
LPASDVASLLLLVVPAALPAACLWLLLLEGELADELDELLSPELELVLLDGERELELCGEADELGPEVRDAALLALGEAFGDALTEADGEAPVEGVIEAAGLALVDGEEPPDGVIDAAGEEVAFVEAAAPLL